MVGSGSYMHMYRLQYYVEVDVDKQKLPQKSLADLFTHHVSLYE